MKTEIPNWVTEYNNAGHQSSAARAIKILMTRIGELENGWISVKDRLPDEGVDVLIYNEHIKVFEVSNFSAIEWPQYVRVEGTEYFRKENSSTDRMWSNNQATHWMPLPNPPQQ